jgi:uncharacterized protein YdhG (YjbR/CyaY superfamily)
MERYEVSREVRTYVEAMPPEHRHLFDRVHRVVTEVHPEASLVLSYKMPTYKIGKRRLYVGAWKHGISVYGWKQGKVAAFTSHHPQMKTSKGTIQLRPEDSPAVSDDDLKSLVCAALDD